jgi:beta-alanine--pyruvate transaminase
MNDIARPKDLAQPVDIDAGQDMEAFWMPFTSNRHFKSAPRMLARAEGMHYWTPDGRRILDAVAGLWCTNAGHCRTPIVEAIQRQAATMDFAPTFQMGHPLAFELSNRLLEILPPEFGQVFYTNSGSEAVDSALKIALAYHRMRGEGQRTRLIGRERGYHGVGFGGISVGGIAGNRKHFGSMLAGVDHLPHTHDLAHNAFTKGQPAWGAHLADELERIVALHDPSTIAAVIVEPVAGSTGVLIPPVGYLQKLREITLKHGILLIFDEVITGFGRLGSPFASQHFGVVPDLVTVAKGITSGTVPMGAVFARRGIYETFMQGPEKSIELFHGYTYSAHPLACAAAIATLDVYQDEGLLTRAATLAPHWEEAVHSLRDCPNVIDVRNIGLIGAIELAPRAGAPGTRAFDAFTRAFHEQDLLIRTTGDIIAMSPPLIVEPSQIDEIVGKLRRVLTTLD